MRIVIDLQGTQSDSSRNRGIGRYSLSLAKSIIRNRGSHDIIVVLNSLFPQAADALYKEFAKILPAQNIVTWYASGSTAYIAHESRRNRELAQYSREIFLANLNADMVLVLSLFEGFIDNAVTSISLIRDIPTAVILYDLIPLIHAELYLEDANIRSWYYEKLESLKRADMLLSISHSAKQEAHDYLNIPEQRVVNISTAAENHFHTKVVTSSDRDYIAEEYNINRAFVMYTGGIDHRKNIEGLIRAYALLPSQIRQNHQLAVVCHLSAENRAKFAQLIEEQDLAADEVIFTGYVPDDDLVTLYNACDLFVFPSWHEGFGLPALEAMLCGRVVIGSDRSSLPEVIGLKEALFDPMDDNAISSKMQMALTDESFRERLRLHAKVQSKKFSWDISAKLAISAIEKRVEQRNNTETIKCDRVHRKPSLAYLSPLPPQRSGISDYSQTLLPQLCTYYEIDVITEDSKSIADTQKQCYTIRSIEYFKEYNDSYDRILYHFGDSRFHRHMFELLHEIPGIVVLHDFFLSGAIAHMAQSDDKPKWWIENLYRSHGYSALVEYYKNPHAIEDMIHKYPINLSVLQDAIGTIVHSKDSMSLRNKWYTDVSSEWSVLPLSRNPSSDFDALQSKLSLGFPDDAIIISSFGIVDPHKLNHRIANSLLASSLAHNEKIYLVFVGDSCDSDYEDEIRALFKGKDIKCHIKITGWLEPEVHQRYLEAADIGIQLRPDSKGESSASVLDCMNYALATIVNVNGAMTDLPWDAVVMLPDKFMDDELTEALEMLCGNDKRREDLGAKARETIAQKHNPAICACHYRSVIEDIYSRKRERASAVIESITKKEGDTIDSELHKLSNDIINNFPIEPRLRKIFIDISILSIDHKSGASKRCFLEMLTRLLTLRFEGYSVEPVYIPKESTFYHYARSFTSGLLGIPSNCLADTEVMWQRGDIFVGSGSRELFAQYTVIGNYMHDIGGYVSYILYEDLLDFDDGEGELAWLQEIAKFDILFTRSRAKLDEIRKRLSDREITSKWWLETPAAQKLTKAIRYCELGKRIKWRVEGPFDSSYSLALVNREFAIALEELSCNVSLHSTEGGGDFVPSRGFLDTHPELEKLYEKSLDSSEEQVEVSSRNIYPPRVKDMKSQCNLMHNYAWEESRFPAEWVEEFNGYLDGLLVTSAYVKKIMIDNGVKVPLSVTSNGVDHWERVITDENYRLDDTNQFRFLHVSSCFPRKGVDILLKSYTQSFTAQDSVVLVIKTFANPHNEIYRWIEEAKEACRDAPDIIVIEDDLTQSQLKSLYRQCDAYVGPSRAEGFGLPFAEAILSGLAVIATGWGGQMDFCNDETAWLIDYRFAPAKTHFDLSDSVWAEPDREHLSRLMREVRTMPLQKRIEKVNRGIEILRGSYRWRDTARRSIESARSFLQMDREHKPKIGWITSWGTKCGIAAYSKHLMDAMGSDVAIFASYSEELLDDEPYVCRCWQAESDNFEKADREIGRLDIDTIVIQFNYGFYDFYSLYNFLYKQLGMQRQIVIMMHSTADPQHIDFKDLRILLPVLEQVDRILVHSIADLNRLKDHGLVDNVTLLPHGTMTWSPAEGTAKSDTFTLGSYGFFLPHKGLLELIDTVAIIRNRGIDIKLKMVNAKYPVTVSQQLVDEASKKIERLGLSEHIELVTDFLSDDDSLGRLSECDLLLFPYQETAESSSASVRYGLATTVPVAVTPLNIFEDVEEATYRLSGFTPEEMAESIIELMDDLQNESERVQKQSLRSAQWCEDHRYSNIGARLGDMIDSLALQAQRV